jgi:hypothetical protein
MSIALTQFAVGRHFNPEFAGTRVNNVSPEVFTNYALHGADIAARDSTGWRGAPGTWEEVAGPPAYVLEDGFDPGYMPACKHLWVRNTLGVRAGVAPIEGNEDRLRSGYVARREGELPVLTRWLEGVEASLAKYLDIVLYSREHLLTEGIELPLGARWGIVSINAELAHKVETPINPVTQLRNALGKKQGGSGHPLDEKEYQKAVAFWDKWAVVK